MDQVEQFLIELATTNLMADEQELNLRARKGCPYQIPGPGILQESVGTGPQVYGCIRG